MLTPFENGRSACDFFFYLSQLTLTTLSQPLCITIISFLWGLVKSPHGIFLVIGNYLYHDMVFFYFGYCFNKFEKRYTKTFMLGIAFLVKYEAVSFYSTSVKNILSSTVSIQKKSAYFFAFSSNSSKYLSKSDIKSLS